MSEFIGEDRLEVLDMLVAAFDSVADHQGPHMLVLSAPSGEGKTRIIQEFYRRIAAGQPSPHYWPAEIVTEEGDWKYDRKRLSVAPFAPDPGSTIPWLYWSVSCLRRSDHTLAQALFQDQVQFEAHAVPLFNVFDRGELAEKTFDGVNAVLAVLGVLGVLTIGGPVGVGIVTLAATKTVVDNKDLVTKFKTWFARHRHSGRDVAIVDGDSFGRQDDIRELANNVVKVSRGVPIVLAVDDAHWADPTLLKFLDEILNNPDADVLIVVASWPDSSESRLAEESFGAWSDDLPSESITRVSLHPLARDELLRLVRSSYSDVAHAEDLLLDDEIAEELVRRFSSPIGIRALFGLDAVQRAIHSGGLEREDLDVLPKKMDEVMDAYWDELPAEVQEVVTVAAQVGEQFASQPVISAAEQLSYSDPRAHLEASKTPFRVVREAEESLDVFTDLLFYRKAQSKADFLPRDLKTIAAAVAAYATTLDPASTSHQLGSFVWGKHVELAREEGGVDRGPAAISAWNLAELAASTYAFGDAVRYGQLALDWAALSADDSGVLLKRSIIASWIRSTGRTAEAASAYRALLDDVSRAFGPDARETFSVRGGLAMAVSLDGRDQEAVDMFKALLEDQVRVLGPDDPDARQTIGYIARSAGYAGRTIEAIEMLEGLLRDQIRLLGPDDPETFSTRRFLAKWTGDAGRIDEAVEMFEALLGDQSRALGSDAPDTLITKDYFADQLLMSGRVERAIERYHALLEDQIRVLGPDAPETLSTRDSLANWTGESGQVDEAVEIFGVLLDDRARVLGPDAQQTLRTRNDLGRWLGRSGRAEEAIETFAALVKDNTRVLGPEARDSLLARFNLAAWTGEAGRHDEAVEMFSGLLDDQIRLRGPNPVDRLSTKYRLALQLQEAGRLDVAIEMFQSLLDDQIRILGPDAQETLRTKDSLGFLLGRSGQVDEALDVFATLLDDQSRILGPDAPDTLRTRNILGFWLGRGGRTEEAAYVFASLLDDQIRILGPDDVETLSTRTKLAYQLADDDARMVEAVELAEALIEDRTRVLGPENEETLQLRHLLAFWMARIGRFNEAVETLRLLNEDCDRVYGPDSPTSLAVEEDLARMSQRSG